MSKTYCFEFSGTRDMFLEKLNQYSNNDHRFFYFDDYIVEILGDNYNFGVQRGGHSGGYWYKPTIIEMTDKLIFTGKIEYIDSHSNDKGFNKVKNKIEEGCLIVVLFPLLLVIYLITKFYAFMSLFINKIMKQPNVKEETTEDRLVYLMENILGCTHK